MFTIYSGWFCIDITQKAGERERYNLEKLLLFFIIIFRFGTKTYGSDSKGYGGILQCQICFTACSKK